MVVGQSFCIAPGERRASEWQSLRKWTENWENEEQMREIEKSRMESLKEMQGAACVRASVGGGRRKGAPKESFIYKKKNS